MTPEQLAKLRELLASGKVEETKLSPERAFLRGWNEGVEFAEKQIKKALEPQAT